MGYQRNVEDEIWDYLSAPKKPLVRDISDIAGELIRKPLFRLFQLKDPVNEFLKDAIKLLKDGDFQEDPKLSEAITLVYRLNGRLMNDRSRDDWASKELTSKIYDSFNIALDANETRPGIQSMIYLEFGGYGEDRLQENDDLIAAGLPIFIEKDHS